MLMNEQVRVLWMFVTAEAVSAVDVLFRLCGFVDSDA